MRYRGATEPDTKSTSSKPAKGKVSEHKNEGFLKSAWHKLTHQHDDLEDDTKPAAKKEDPDESKKKASGSGSS